MTLSFSIGHGFETVASFWGASDMNGMPISGSYIIFISRFVPTAVLVGIPSYMVPAFHKIVGVILATIVIVIALALLVFLLWSAWNGGNDLGFGAWYRFILEIVSCSVGAIFGAILGSTAGQARRLD
jgi:hypothetical protein